MVINENLNLDIEINRDEKDLGWLLGEVVGDGCPHQRRASDRGAVTVAATLARDLH